MNWLEACRKRWVVWVWRHTPRCREMSRLASQALERPLPLGLRLRMRLHQFICRWCQRYEQQVHLLHRLAPGLAEHAAESPVRGLSSDARQRLLRTLRDAGGAASSTERGAGDGV